MSVNRGRTLVSLLIPSSYTEESPDPRIKTYKVGQTARAAAIFRVDEIVIYRTSGPDDTKFISTILRYAETPQYLRKALFPMQDALRYRRGNSAIADTITYGLTRIGIPRRYCD